MSSPCGQVSISFLSTMCVELDERSYLAFVDKKPDVREGRSYVVDGQFVWTCVGGKKARPERTHFIRATPQKEGGNKGISKRSPTDACLGQQGFFHVPYRRNVCFSCFSGITVDATEQSSRPEYLRNHMDALLDLSHPGGPKCICFWLRACIQRATDTLVQCLGVFQTALFLRAQRNKAPETEKRKRGMRGCASTCL